MSHQLIDMTKDPRSGQFACFRQMLFPFAGVTAEVDITDFAARRQGRPFFLSFLYAVVRAANAVPQLRRCIRADGKRGGIRLVSALLHRHEARRGVCILHGGGGPALYGVRGAGAAAAAGGLSQELSQKKILQFRLQAKGVMYHVLSLSRTQ